MPRLCFALIALLIVLSSAAAAVDGHGIGSDPAVIAGIDAILGKETRLKGGIQGIVVQDAAAGTILYERNADVLLLPASNQKLLTSAAVLAALGPDWRYCTRLMTAGSIDHAGTLHGDLYLVGSGDPLLTAADLDEIVRSAREIGLRRVVGNVVGDDSRFDSDRYGDGWAWDDMPWYYSAQISGLNVDENVVLVRVEPGDRAGRPVKVAVTSSDRYMPVRNRAVTVPKGQKSSLRIGRDIGSNVILVSGTLAVDAPAADHRAEPITVENPTRYAAALLAERLRHGGIEVAGTGTTGRAPAAGLTELATHESAPMAEILKKLNKPSDNLVAECLLKTLSAQRGKGSPGSAAEGRSLAEAWFASVGLDPNGVDMADGSGLSRQDHVTPRSVAKLLAVMRKHPYGQAYIDSLPIAGVDGSLRNRMKGTPAEGKCHAKTGYVSSVSSLSGYLTTTSGRELIFSMLMNNHKAPNSVPVAVQNEIVVFLASH